MPDDSSQRPDGVAPEHDVDPTQANAGAGQTPGDEDEPTRFRVADTGWPPPAAAPGSALPRRTPGASGGPGGAAAPAAGPATDGEAAPLASATPAPATPEGFAGPPVEPPVEPEPTGVTSPPLDDEPWAGLPAPGPDVPADGGAPPVAADPPSAGPPSQGERSAADLSPSAAPAADGALHTSGRHRGPRSRRGRLRSRGRRRRGDGDPEPAPLGADTTAADAATGATEAGDAGRSGLDAGTAPGLARTSLLRAWPGLRLGALALAVVALIVFGVLTIYTRLWPGPAGNPYTSASTKAAVAAATAVAPPILSYDYTTIDKKAAAVAPLQTATCARQYQQLIVSAVKPLAVQNKATQQATVLAAGVTTASKDAVTVLAFMQLTSTNSVKTGKAINEAQISLSMVKQHGRWLLAGTSANGAGGGGAPSCGGASPTGK